MRDSTTVQFAPGATVLLRGPASIQFGIDATRSGVIETPVAAALADVLSCLRVPTRLDALAERARRACGLSENDTLSLVAELVSYRVLLTGTPRPVALIGRSPLAAAITPLLVAARIPVRAPLRGESPERFLDNCDPTIPLVVVDQLSAATIFAHALRRHTGPTFAASLIDARTFLGPLKTGHGGPCLHCTHLYHHDRDANWGRVTRQARANPTPPDPLVVAAGAAAAACIIRRLCGAPDPPGVSAPAPERGTFVVVDPFGPVPFTRDVLDPHPSCPVCY
ncbi:hypothetical protein [Corynebacterium timonense]|uniref:Bacteriocin biosynthesis cyclodehydratase domain-containing protein n=1 Tax=Corynebacterium timonense TaxID=441500 RepID=A0A1H1RMJ3_9CORY|nr:hypothetical protein [Corynebacterium timonense]SDS36925.1 hypothetical protein SAMN04488539_1539 [Corynebacterium timonense]